MNGLPKPAYILSEPHLSGHRVILGYEALTDAQNAHAMLAAAPAVQPAAVGYVHAEIAKGGAFDHATIFDDCVPVLHDVPLYAHPPAQGSESGGEAVEQACGLTVDMAISQPAEALSILRALPKSQSLFVWADGSYRIAPTLDVAIARQEEGSLVAVIPMTDLNAALSQPGPASEGEAPLANKSNVSES
jgi:hypothetical protein